MPRTIPRAGRSRHTPLPEIILGRTRRRRVGQALHGRLPPTAREVMEVRLRHGPYEKSRLQADDNRDLRGEHDLPQPGRSIMTRSKPITFLAGAAAVPLIALAVAGCGGSNDNNNASANNAPASTRRPQPRPRPAARERSTSRARATLARSWSTRKAARSTCSKRTQGRRARALVPAPVHGPRCGRTARRRSAARQTPR